MINFSIGICAYNEEKNIGDLLGRLMNQKIPKGFSLNEIVVVASGCTDGTESIVKEFSRKFRKIKLISEKKRTGKSHAVNILLSRVKCDIMAMIGADNLPHDSSTIANILVPFLSDDIGIVGGRPIPTNDFESLTGFIGNFIWEFHHQISLEDPKIGEFIAFRPELVRHIPNNSAVDEASIESIITGRQYKKIYAPKAIVLNRSPDSLMGIFNQRKRIYIGHLHLARTEKYKVSSMKYSSMLAPFLRNIQSMKKKVKFGPATYLKVLAAVTLEFSARASAAFDFYIRKKNPYKWDTISTTKKV
jgi:biofilm PGA synthesis N-glycosyltransferase PgaC